jgi:monoamine oxidase
VLTGWFAGPKADKVGHLTPTELVEMGLTALVEIFDLPGDRVTQDVTASRAVNWGNDPFACGAYSYATPQTWEAQIVLKRPCDSVFFSGEALYAGPDMGTVEAALASGLETAQMILAAEL